MPPHRAVAPSVADPGDRRFGAPFAGGLSILQVVLGGLPAPATCGNRGVVLRPTQSLAPPAPAAIWKQAMPDLPERPDESDSITQRIFYGLAGGEELTRTRRALAQLVEVLITRGVLTEADTHAILSGPGSR